MIVRTHQDQHKPFARKYRPRHLAELYGQDIIVKIIDFTVRNNKLPYAYLLTGTRGTGKTSIARIIAQLINCTNLLLDGDWIQSCGVCNNCISMVAHPDIVEIDAASNTGIEDIKIVIEQAAYKPFLGRYKVFIIDEVHMLSKSAFNALLKSIEEPCDNVLFIFATTEITKVPLTIISRCQRFDFKQLSQHELERLINKVCDKESISCDADAISIIAKRSGGSARDCISILEQVSLAGYEQITAALVNEVLYLANTQDILTLVSHMANKDFQKITTILETMWDKNIDFVILCEDIIEVIAEITKAKILGAKSQNFPTRTAENQIANIISANNTILSNIDIQQLTITWQLFVKTLQDLKYAHDPKLYVEMVFIKAIHFINLDTDVITPNDVDNNATKQQMPEQRKALGHNPAVVEKIVVADTNVTEPSIALLEFLEYLYKKYEFDLYYYLMNEVEVLSMDNDNQLLKIAGLTITQDRKNQIIRFINALTQSKWELSFICTSNFINLKEKMKSEFAKSQMMQIIKTKFPNHEFLDILFKEGA